MKFVPVLFAFATVFSAVVHAAPSAETLAIAQEVAAKVAKVKSFSATVETGEEAGGGTAPKSQSSLLVSRDFGWKMLGKESGEAYQLVTDYTTFYQYFPSEKRVMKTTADRPEIKAMLIKPASDMNPLSLMDPQSMRFEGKETFEGETVYRVSGTTDSQMMPGGPSVRRLVTALISVEDGLPRKTLESVGLSTGTTIYKNVKLNPEVSASDFIFAIPEGATVVDVNEQMRRMDKPGARGGAAPPAGQL